MHKFTDRTGREWLININVWQIKRVRALIDVDLAAFGRILEPDGDARKTVDKVITDPVAVVDVLYCLCKEQAEKTGVTDRDFGESFDGQTIEDATDALLRELADFYPPPLRTVLREVIDDAGKAAAKAREMLTRYGSQSDTQGSSESVPTTTP